MTPGRKRNLARLLRPRHMAVIGGRDALTVIGECDRIGFPGPIWPVNPRRETMAGRRCFAQLEDLPEAPDAAFVAVARDATIDAVSRLAAIGAGGAVCYAAGFGETEDGDAAERSLIEAAGDLALVGPNCYGVISYLDRAALWPFAHGGGPPVEGRKGVAIVTQSGMLSSDLTMAQRSVPLTHMISAGNQAVLRLEDFIDALIDTERVAAIGLHIEGLRDVALFEAAAERAVREGVPIVALKSGVSKIGAQLTVSHTGSLSGDDELYQALFDRLGVIRVDTPAGLLETTKLLAVAGAPKGPRLAAFTCSGGGATMLADLGEPRGLQFPAPSAEARALLQDRLPPVATPSNPLDYTTPIWGDAARVRPVFDAMLSDPYDAAVLVQDYPAPGLDESKPSYWSDATAFADATEAAGAPAAICSTLPENFDTDTREQLIARGVAPLQGVREALDAFQGGAVFSRRRAALIRAPRVARPRPASAPPIAVTLDEWRSKRWLAEAGIAVPEGRLCAMAAAAEIADTLGFPVAVKLVGSEFAHKTEVGAVALNLRNHADVSRAVAAMEARHGPDQTVLVERMAPKPVAELLVSVRVDPAFGAAMTLASGGVLVEILGPATTVLLPAPIDDLDAALEKLWVAPLLRGYRGAPAADRAALLRTIATLADHAVSHLDALAEIEINPLFAGVNGTVAVDALLSGDAEKLNA